ncbi:TauD/TfdA dioxygenase family protein [Glycomyces paridis]|uniref:TauD/TfdA family dioxygenase n=1 Tax=Glycomyces paridis TaxID=2126555 RepID=A0A4S8PFC4_9ACTN|nr:TauD/TfdA family dioxygenase [Glycomyces paridis]THV29133.1 TauD/TfdA family dioxygenase [Glycomyces paridis]
MEITPQETGKFGAIVTGFDAATATAEELQRIKDAVYADRIVLLKDQALDTGGFVGLGRALGEVETYYEPMYHHPEHAEVFVSSNVPQDGQQVGVPKTGKFWHADYMFMPRPFGLTLIYPQQVPEKNRGTYFIDMSEAYERLPEHLKLAVKDTYCLHSPRKYFKIRPSDVYRPIGEIYEEIELKTPPAKHPTVFEHPVTGRPVLYASAGLTYAIEDADGNDLGDLLEQLFEATGQTDMTFPEDVVHLQTFERGDLLVWDNRALIHRALHTTTPEPAVSFRVTVHDDHPFYAQADA